MCCSVTPNTVVEFSNTVLYGAEIAAQGEIVHVLGYQNKVGNASSKSGWWQGIKNLFPTAAGGNAMLLPIPAVPRTMTKENVLKTEDCKEVLQDIARAVRKPLFQPQSRAQNTVSWQMPPQVQIFEAAGIYTVVLAQDANDIPGALALVPKEKRPALNPQLFKAYAEWYPGWTFALCCFNNRQAKLAAPLVWWYQPMNPERIFLPALDSHTGKTPDLSKKVYVDHTIAVGSYLSVEKLAKGLHTNFNALKYVGYQDSFSDDRKPYFLSYVMGTDFKEDMPNGDFVFELGQVRNEIFAPQRELPPGNTN